jgi:hypothetical protein
MGASRQHRDHQERRGAGRGVQLRQRSADIALSCAACSLTRAVSTRSPKIRPGGEALVEDDVGRHQRLPIGDVLARALIEFPELLERRLRRLHGGPRALGSRIRRHRCHAAIETGQVLGGALHPEIGALPLSDVSLLRRAQLHQVGRDGARLRVVHRLRPAFLGERPLGVEDYEAACSQRGECAEKQGDTNNSARHG